MIKENTPHKAFWGGFPVRDKVYIYANKRRVLFPARLLSEEGKLLEFGQASISAEQDSVDFVGDFVPLFKMGTPLTIVRTFGEQEIHIFRGEVYLSSRKLLRLTSVSDELLPGSERVYLFPVNFPAQVTAFPPAEPPRRALFPWKRSVPPGPQEFLVSLNFVAMDALEFTSPVELPPQSTLCLTMEKPVEGYQLPLAVKRVLQFGSSGRTYSCLIEKWPLQVLEKWEKHLMELHQKENKLF